MFNYKHISLLRFFLSFCLLVFIIGLTCCNNFTSWTDEQRKAFQFKCNHTDSVTDLGVSFIGFSNAAFDSVLIKEFKEKTVVDSFKIFVRAADGSWERENKVRYAEIGQTLCIHHTYQFIVPGQKPYELANMKMVMWPTYSMSSENYNCEMGDYTLNGTRFTNVGGPQLCKAP
jgi:hypothetical protein